MLKSKLKSKRLVAMASTRQLVISTCLETVAILWTVWIERVAAVSHRYRPITFIKLRKGAKCGTTSAE
jgi:hypothetical protein